MEPGSSSVMTTGEALPPFSSLSNLMLNDTPSTSAASQVTEMVVVVTYTAKSALT